MHVAVAKMNKIQNNQRKDTPKQRAHQHEQ